MRPAVVRDKLASLAGRINAGHEECHAIARSAVAKAIEVGGWLAEARDQVDHGEWGAWVESNCVFTPRQAQKYMRAFENREAIEAEMRTPSSHLTSLNRALEVVAEPRNEPLSQQEADLLNALETMIQSSINDVAQSFWNMGDKFLEFKGAHGRKAYENALSTLNGGNRPLNEYCVKVRQDHRTIEGDVAKDVFAKAIDFYSDADLVAIAKIVRARNPLEKA